MKREILFRAKSIQNKEFIYGMPTYDFKYMFSKENMDSCDNYQVDPETVCQFTGLTDKNGTKIFEGDILKVELFRVPHFISFGKSEKWGASFCSESKYSIIYLNKRYAESSEVVGNIHDNPELLFF